MSPKNNDNEDMFHKRALAATVVHAIIFFTIFLSGSADGRAAVTQELAPTILQLIPSVVEKLHSGNTATMVTPQHASVTQVVDEKTARALDCRSTNEYSFVVVQNPNRKNDSDPLILNIVVGDDVVSKIELPKESEVKNFSLNSLEKTKAGFEMRVDWGGGVYHYEIQFNFRCKENKFYLYEVTKKSFSTTNPDSGNFLDKKKSKVTKIEPNLPIEKFVMTDYL